MAYGWCPPARPGQGICLPDLPTEMLLMIIDFLDDRCERWNFALAYPQVPQLMLPLLKDCKIHSHTCKDNDEVGHINTVLSFIHQYPMYSREIRSLTYIYHHCHQSDHRRGNICSPPVAASVRPKLYALAHKASLDVDQGFLTSLMAGNQLSNFSLLLGLLERVDSVHLKVETRTWCDFGHITKEAFEPAAVSLRRRKQILENLSISKSTEGDSTFDRNIRMIIPALFALPGINNLELKHLVESVCHRGSLDGVMASDCLKGLSLVDCRYHAEFIPDILRCNIGLTSFEYEPSVPVFPWFPFMHSASASQGYTNPIGMSNGMLYSGEGYKRLISALEDHRDTLRNLKLALPGRFHDHFPCSSHTFDISESVGSLKSFHRLKRLEICPSMLFCRLKLVDILPASIHNFVVTFMNTLVADMLAAFAEDLYSTNKAGFVHLTHIVDASNMGNKSCKDRGPLIKKEHLDHLRSVDISLYPDDANFGHGLYYQQDIARRGLKKKLERETFEHNDLSRCTGECCGERT